MYRVEIKHVTGTGFPQHKTFVCAGTGISRSPKRATEKARAQAMSQSGAEYSPLITVTRVYRGSILVKEVMQ